MGQWQDKNKLAPKMPKTDKDFTYLYINTLYIWEAEEQVHSLETYTGIVTRHKTLKL